MASATYAYDALGNVTNDGTHAYTYDAENRMTQVDNGATATYIYDAFSRRVRVNAGTNSRECVFDLSGACIAELSTTSGAWLKSDIRALGQTIATYTGSGGTTYFNHADQIGSLRAQSTVAGAVQTTCTYDPFGSTFQCSGGGSSTRDQFTGDEHDSESNLEHTQFRQLNTLAGRWMSPDPYAGSVDITNPQSLNRYSYVLGMPLSRIDRLGLCDAVIGGIAQTSNSPGVADFATLIQADLAYPYPLSPSYLTDLASGVLSVMEQGLGFNNEATQIALSAVRDAISQTPADQKTNVFTFSGGAQAFTNAFNLLTPDEQSRIGKITYVAPGNGSALADNGSADVITNPIGWDPIISGSTAGANLLWSDCGHNFACISQKAKEILKNRAGAPCPKKNTFGPGTSGIPYVLGGYIPGAMGLSGLSFFPIFGSEGEFLGGYWLPTRGVLVGL